MESKIKLEKLNDNNYSSWAYRCQLALQEKNLWNVITEKRPEPDGSEETTQAIAAWNKSDGTAKFLIGTSVENNQLHLIKRTTSAREAWNNIKNHHKVPTVGSQVRLLTRLFTERITHNGDMRKHINKMMTIMDELAEMDAPVEPRYAVGAMIASVNKYYSSLITGVEAWNDERLTMQTLNAKLIEEWRKRQMYQPRFERSEAPHLTKEKVNPRSSEINRMKSAIHKPLTASAEGSSSSSRSNKTEKYTGLNKEEKEDGDQWYSDCVFTGKARAHTAVGNKDIWIIDSGASAHMCAWRNFFDTLDVNKKGTVTVADGKQVKALGTGNIRLTIKTEKGLKPIQLIDVLYVPKLNSNLISVSKLGGKGHTVMFTGQECFVKSKNNYLRVGTTHSGMYKLEHLRSKEHSQTEENHSCSEEHLRSKEHSQAEENHSRSEEHSQTEEQPKHCIHEWHRKLAHRNLDDIRRMKTEGINIKKCKCSNDCEPCMKGKMSRKPFPEAQPIQEPLDVIVSDVCGPLPTESINKKRYFVTFTDAYSKYTETFFMREKSEVTQIAIDFVERLHTQFGKWPKIFRSDRGKEYINDRFQRYLTRRGIKSEFTVGYAPEQNGIAERKNRTLMEATRTMLASSELPKNLWTEAIATATFIFNRIINKRTKKTPYESLHGRKHQFVKFHEFGSHCYIMIPDEKRRKLDNKATEGRFLGYDFNSKGYRVLIGNRKVVVSREVRFMKPKRNNQHTDSDEEFDWNDLIDQTQPMNSQVEEEHSRSEEHLRSKEHSQVEEEHSRSEEHLRSKEHSRVEEEHSRSEEHSDAEENITVTGSPNSTGTEYYDADDASEQSSDDDEDTIVENTTDSGGVEPRWNFTRTNRGKPAEKYDPCNFTDDKAHRISCGKDPTTFKEAMNSTEAEEWLAAMENELNAIERNNTWIVTDLPQGRKPIGCRWVFKTKRNEHGNVIEQKARLVAQGFSQKFGTDFDEVFAPVARGTTFRTLLSVAGNRHYRVEHWDVKAAFLNGELKEEIFMKQPPGFEQGNKVVQLKKSLYGLKQAAHVWNQTIHNVLEQMEFTQSTADKCLYIKQKDGKIVYLLIHVDDILAASNSEQALEATRQRLGNHFELKNLGGASQYLGIDIERIDNEIFISQTPYIDSIVKEAGLSAAKESAFPLDVGYFKVEQTATPDQLRLLENNHEYRKLIGMLLYIVVNTRPDIAASIAILSKKVEQPRNIDMNELKRVIRYLKGTRELKLKLNDKRNNNEKLIAFSDANWAEDRTDRKSTSGHYCNLNGGTISWFSRKQNIIALSSCEAEYVALAETCKEVTWIREILKSFGITTSEATLVYTDNQSCIAMVENKKQSNKTKHIDIKYHYVKEEVERKQVILKYVPTEHNVADLMTKPLGRIKTEQLRKDAGLDFIRRKQQQTHCQVSSNHWYSN